MSILNYSLTKFIASYPNLGSMPKEEGVEIVFAGYSNVGKSSTLNVVTNQKKLAYKSKTPGSTKLINVFEIESAKNLVDLPGYGYAKVNKKNQINLKLQIYEYLKKRTNLKGLIILIDIRRLIRDIDYKIINIAINRKIPILILLSKADKLSYNQRLLQLNAVKKNMLYTYSQYNISNFQIEIFSALTKLGLQVLKKTLDQWLS